MSDPTAVPFRPNASTFNSVALPGSVSFRFNVAPASTARFEAEAGGKTLAIAFHDYLGDFSLDGQDPDTIAAINLNSGSHLFNRSEALVVGGLDLRGGAALSATMAAAILSNSSGGWDRSGANSGITGNFLFGASGAAGIVIA